MSPPRFLERFGTPRSATAGDLEPRRRLAPDGAPRRVGVEVEFAGLELDRVAAVVQAALGGEIFEETDYVLRVATEGLGEFRVEVDNAHLKRIGRERRSGHEPGFLASSAESLMVLAAGGLTPLELVSPPLQVEELPMLEKVVDALGAAGAEGTDGGPLYAFGVHLNPEAASHDAADLHAHLRSFAALSGWLRTELETDRTRRLTPYVDPFPRDYVSGLLAASVPPASRPALVRSYLAANATRNRALDMLPLFLHLEPELVRAAVEDPRLKARPTFHFRLPDSRIGEPGWRLLDAWRAWLVVEDLALDHTRLDGLCAAVLEALSRPFDPPREELSDLAHEWLTRDLG